MKVNHASTVIVVALISAFSLPIVHAAEAESDVMGKGNTQLEFKLGSSRDSAAKYSDTSIPFTARIGVSDSAEIRIVTGGYIKSKVDDTNTKGWSDINLGLRYRSQELDEKTGSIGMAWQFEQGIPTGLAAFSSPGGSTALKFTTELALPNEMSVGAQPGFFRVRNSDGAWFVAPSLSLTLGKNWSPVMRSVIELIAPQVSSAVNGGNVVFLSLGTTYRLTDIFELEAIYARSLNKNAPQNNFAAGVNVKF